MTLWEQGFQRGIIGQAIGLVVALTLFVLHNAALQVQNLLAHLTQQVAHTVRFQIQRVFQCGRGHGLEIVGAIKPGGAVQGGGPCGIHGLDVAGRAVFRPAEHQVLEQVGKAGRALGFVFRAHIVPDTDGHDRSLVVFVDQYGQAIIQLETLPRNIHACDQIGDRRTAQFLRLSRAGRSRSHRRMGQSRRSQTGHKGRNSGRSR